MENNIYELIKNNPDGIDRDSIISIINDQLHIDTENAYIYLQDLIVQGKIKLCNINSETRFQSTVGQIKEKELDVKIIGSPQSSRAIYILNQTLISYPDNLTLVIDVTSPKTFKNIEKRIQNRLHTTVLLPPKKEIEQARVEVYEKIIKEWKELFKRNKSFNSLFLLKSTLESKSIRTTMLTDEFARINVRSIISTTTRNGIIIEVDKDNALYAQYASIIKKQIETSLPFFTLNPIKYFKKIILMPVMILCLVVGAIIIFYNSPLTVISSVFCGVLGNIIYGKYKTT